MAAEVQESIIRQYVDFVNTYSVYRTRLQSKTGDDKTNEEDFEEQLDQLFRTGDSRLRKVLDPEAKDEPDPEVPELDPDIAFIQNVGRLLLTSRGSVKDYAAAIGLDTQQKFEEAFQVLFNHFDKESSEPDARTYAVLLQFLRHEYNVLQEQTSNATVLSQIRSHKARRSQVCRNVYRTPYPGEVYGFASQKLGKL